MNAGEFREVGHRVVDLLAEYLETHRGAARVSRCTAGGPNQALRRGAASGSQLLRSRFWLSWNKSFCLTAPMSDIRAIWG